MPDRGPWGRRAAPDPAPPPPAEAAPSHYPCASCGAVLTYRPGETRLTCPFCGATADIAPADAATLEAAWREHDYEAALAGQAAGVDFETTQVVHCEACGANVDFDPGQHAALCPFCATPMVADTTPDRHIKPQGLLPFAIDAREAQARVTRWLGRLWFAPSGLKQFARARGALSGVYTPWWTFDARTETAYAGERGDTYFVTVRGKDGKPQQVPRIRWSPARGRVARDFDDVLTCGSTTLPEAQGGGFGGGSLGGWDLSDLRPYSRDWLAGFRAEAYTIDLRAAYGAARAEMEGVIAMDVRRAIGGDQQRVHRMDTRVSGVTFKHVLLPVWIGAYRWKGSSFRVVVNGRTGAVRGQRPWSAWKIALAVLAAAAAGALALWLFAEQQGGL